MATTTSTARRHDTTSVSTTSVDHRIITYPGGEKEYVIKFLFCPNTGNNNTAIARMHYAILKTITEMVWILDTHLFL